MRDDRDLYRADFTHQLDELRASRAPTPIFTRHRVIFAALLTLGAVAMAIGAILSRAL